MIGDREFKHELYDRDDFALGKSSMRCYSRVLNVVNSGQV